MQTTLAPKIKQSRHAEAIESILRKCVHCGFCNATCPTYQLRGDELDGPRGRIYQMKQYFEGAAANAEMLKHLDRCLTCRSCETTCPSGVHYSRLLEIGKQMIEVDLPRSRFDRLRRAAIVRYINSGKLFATTLRFAQALAWMMPASIQRSIPARRAAVPRVGGQHASKVLMLAGCVQPALAPNTNTRAINLLDKLGIEVIEIPQNLCCGAAALHTSEPAFALRQIRRLIDHWWPHIEAGVEAIVVTASGCGVSVRDYAHLLADDPDYADKAQKVSELYRDLIEVVEAHRERIDVPHAAGRRVAVHTPCTMQHGLGLNNRVERLLSGVGYQLCRVEDAHLCCGSAGTYSLLQPKISGRLQRDKLQALTVDRPDVIATANIGCQLQLSKAESTPVVHWIELL